MQTDTTPPSLHALAKDSCIILIGMASAGKSTIGKLLANRLDWAYIDTDHIIEAYYGTRLQTITDAMTKDEFLDMEGESICRLGAKRCVIATGGSVVYRPNAIDHLKTLGPLVHLEVSLPLILERLAAKPDRGLAIAPGQTFEDLYNERKELYASAAGYTIHADSLTPEECVQAIIQELQ